jgi:double-strand break repair protein MRE11
LAHRHVGLIKIQGKEFEFEPIRLRSVRPFVFEEISLAEYHDKQTEEKKKLNTKIAVNKYLKGKVRLPSISPPPSSLRSDETDGIPGSFAQVNELIVKANAEWDELNPDKADDERLLPLIRLRVRPFLPVSSPFFSLTHPLSSV